MVPAQPAARPSTGLRIGVDFDNTIAGYDEVFLAGAKQLGLVDAGFQGRKRTLRDAVCALPDGELAWQRLQGQVYGADMGGAVLFAGVPEFLRSCRKHGHKVFIVSHKTEYGHFDPLRINLRDAALDWMRSKGLFSDPDFAIAPENVMFASTRAEKLATIARLGCTHFIDDLEEVFADPDFPVGVMPILFAERAGAPGSNVNFCTTWREIAEAVFGERG